MLLCGFVSVPGRCTKRRSLRLDRTRKPSGIPKNAMSAHRRFCFACAVALLVVPAQASAYIDPSSGSMLLQIAVGGLLAAMAALKMYWGKVRSAFRRKPSSQ